MQWNLRILVKAIATCAAAFAMAFGADCALAGGPANAPEAVEKLTIVVPGAPGGGWDLTAKALQHAVMAEGLARDVEVVRYPGAGGLVGLSQFSARYRNNPNALMVGGLVMLGASMRDEAAVSLRDVSPVARLTGDWEAIAVPAGSSIVTVADLREVMQTNPNALRWVGGALGGPDQSAVWAVARALGVSLDDISYFTKSGGDRVGVALTSGKYNIGASGYAEFQPFIRNGKIRIIAVAAPRRLTGVSVPTLRENGIDVTVMNWRGVFAAPGLSLAQRNRLERLVATMRNGGQWRSELADEHWTDMFLAGDRFTQFIDREQVRWSTVLDSAVSAKKAPQAKPRGLGPLPWLLVILMATIAVTTVLGWRLRRQKQESLARKVELDGQQSELTSRIEEIKSSTVNLVKEGVDEDFGDWKLSSAERDIAWFMLRGLPLKQIGLVRGTSERTVRQQAQAIYRKAGLEGRSDLAGRVLERFI